MSRQNAQEKCFLISNPTKMHEKNSRQEGMWLL